MSISFFKIVCLCKKSPSKSDPSCKSVFIQKYLCAIFCPSTVFSPCASLTATHILLKLLKVVDIISYLRAYGGGGQP